MISRNFHSAWILLQILVNFFLDCSSLGSHKIHKRKQLLSLACRRLGVQLLQEFQNCSEQMDVRKIHNTEQRYFLLSGLSLPRIAPHCIYTNGTNPCYFGRNANISLKLFFLSSSHCLFMSFTLFWHSISSLVLISFYHLFDK